MLLSIIIPTLNEEKYLPRLISSIKEQDFNDYEIIVSDGESQDGTRGVAESFACRFIQDGGLKHPSHQRNVGASLAKGDLLLFLDADTVLSEGFLGKAVEQFKNRNLQGAGFYINFNPNRLLYGLFASVLNLFCASRQYFAPAAVGAGLLASKAIHDKINGFDEEIVLAEDYDYCFRISKQGKFRMIKGLRLMYSARRMEKDGILNTLLKWLKMALFTLFNFKIKKKIVKYDFGKY